MDKEIIPVWIDTLVDGVGNIKSPKDMLPYFKYINTMMMDEDFKSYNYLLKTISLDDMCESLMVGLLGITNVWRTEIDEWDNFLHKVCKELDRRELNSAELLAGLEYVKKKKKWR
jgi:hypothetical protein